ACVRILRRPVCVPRLRCGVWRSTVMFDRGWIATTWSIALFSATEGGTGLDVDGPDADRRADRAARLQLCRLSADPAPDRDGAPGPARTARARGVAVDQHHGAGLQRGGADPRAARESARDRLSGRSQ